MRIALLAAVVALLIPVVAFGQQRSACLEAVPPGVLLNICEHYRGMAPLPEPALYFRLYKDGRAEFETRMDENDLIRKELKVKAEDVSELKRLGAMDDVQKALAKYPTFRLAYDSTQELIITVYGETSQKRITLENFAAGDRENKEHYPASLIALMKRVEELARALR